MFKIYGVDDLVKNQSISTTATYNHTELLVGNDELSSIDLNRPLQNLYENDFELYSFLENFVRQNTNRKGVFPNSFNSAFVLNNTVDFKSVTIKDATTYYLRLTPGIAGFEFTGPYEKGFIVVNKPNIALAERQIMKAIGMYLKDGTECVKIKYDYTNKKYKMRIVKANPSLTTTTYDVINDAASFDSDVDGKGYNTAFEMIAAIYGLVGLENINIASDDLSAIKLEPTFKIPSAGTYYVKISNSGNFVCNISPASGDEMLLHTVVVTGTTTLSASITDNRLLYVNGNLYTNKLELNDNTGTGAYDTNLYRSAVNTLKTDDNLIVDLDLTVNGNVTLGNAGTNSVKVRGNIAVRNDGDTADTFSIDNATGDTIIAGNLNVNGSAITIGDDANTDVVTFKAANTYFKGTDNTTTVLTINNLGTIINDGSFTVNGSSILGNDIASDSITLNSTFISDLVFNDADRTIKLGGSAGSITNRTLTITNSGSGLAHLTVEGDITSSNGNLITNNATSTIFNTVATTLSIGGASTTLNLANTATLAQTINIGTSVIANTQTINIGGTNAAGVVNVKSTKEATSTTDAGLVISSGVGIAKKLYVGGVTELIGDVNINTNKFNVVASTGNTTIAGTLNVTSGDITSTRINGLTITTVTGKTLNLSVASLTVGTATNTGTITVTSSDTTARTLTLSGSPTLAGTGTATLTTNLTVNTGNITLSGNAAGSSLTLPATGTVATLAGSEALTNKTVNGLTITSSTKTLNLANASLTIGDGTGTGTVTIKSPTANATTIIGPDNGTTTLQAGTMALTGSPLSQFAATTSAELAGVISDETGTGALVFGTNATLTNPTMTTPTLGVASATTINKVTITAPTTGSTLTIADGKTLTASNTLTFNGTDGTTASFLKALTVGAAATYTGAVTVTSNGTNATIIRGPDNGTAVLQAGTMALTGSGLNQFAATTSAQLLGVISDETGSGLLVFNNTPTLTTPTIARINGSVAASGTLALYSTSHATKAAAGITMPDNIVSTSTTTGTLVITGGIGISQNSYIGGTLNVTGNSTLTGSVGIGVAPSEKLHLQGNMRIDDSSGNTGFTMSYNNTSKTLNFNYIGA